MSDQQKPIRINISVTGTAEAIAEIERVNEAVKKLKSTLQDVGLVIGLK